MEYKWDESLSVDEETIDNQHKRLIAQLDKLVKELSNGVDMRPMRETLNFLIKYTKEHFNYEEEYMEKHNYPGLEDQKKFHAKFIQFYNNFNEKFETIYGSGNISSNKIQELLEEAKKFLADWYMNHIKVEDHKFAEYIKAHEK